MKLKIQVLLVVVGGVALLLPMFFMSGWPKYLLMFVGSLMLHAVWDFYAGPPLPDERSSESFQGFEETNIGDCMQDWRGFNGHEL